MTTHATTCPNSAASVNKLIFGGPGGEFSSLHNIGGKSVIIKGASKVDSIKIAGVQYGADGGREQAHFTLPADGAFHLREIRVNDLDIKGVGKHMTISYLEIEVDGKVMEVGKKDNKIDVVFNVDLDVKLTGIHYGKLINKLEFEIVSKTIQATHATPDSCANTLVRDTLIFRGSGGDFSPIQDIGGQFIIFKGAAKVDSIQIGHIRYGGDGGKEQARAKLPANGRFRLLELRCNKGSNSIPTLSYLKLEIDGDTIEAGRKDNSQDVTLTIDRQVRLSGINYVGLIDGLQFEVVS